MTSGKATFYSKDPASAGNDKSGGIKKDAGASSGKATFYSKDPTSTIDDQLGIKEDCGSTKASFYSRDPTPATSDLSKSNKKKYMGEERRRKNRRVTQDRRNDVRFDLTKTERRQSDGRRATDNTVKFWS